MVTASLNPELLRWALADSERSLPDVARLLRKDESLVRAWVAGEKKPSRGDLKKIGAYVGRSLHFFALPAPPSPDLSSQALYRRAFGSDAADSEAQQDRAAELKMLKEAEWLQRLAVRMSAWSHYDAPSVPEDPREAAESLRGWLGWDTASQVQASSKSAAFRRLRLTVEAAGIAVLVKNCGTSSFCGFALPHARQPLILINRDFDLASVRSFTLMHEVGHVVRSTAHICYGGDAGVERWCNRFAGAFLLPAPHVAQYLERQGLPTATPQDLDTVRRVANRYKTSWLAAAIALEEMGAARRGTAEAVRASKPELPDTGFGRGPSQTRPLKRLDEFGSTFTEILGNAVGEGRVSALDACRQLRVDLTEFRAATDLAEANLRQSRSEAADVRARRR